MEIDEVEGVGPLIEAWRKDSTCPLVIEVGLVAVLDDMQGLLGALVRTRQDV